MRPMLKLLELAISNVARPVVFEIGAHHCESTPRILEVFSNEVSYYAFEPDPRNIAVCMRHPLVKSKRIRFMPVAIGDQKGRRVLHMSGGRFRHSKDWNESSSLLRPSGHLILYPEISFDREEEVDVLTIDGVCENEGIDHIDFIWMDVQGAEHLVFNGAKRMLPKTHFIYTECSKVDELYCGQMVLDKLLGMLPNGFRVSQDYESDVFLENTTF